MEEQRGERLVLIFLEIVTAEASIRRREAAVFF
jgi:hypothetical protein